MCFCLLCRDYEKLNYCQLLVTITKLVAHKQKLKIMKPKKLKLPTTLLLLLPLCVVLLGSGCDDDYEQDIWEISPDSKIAVIQKEVDGIEFKFCLLNENDEAATVFNKGEDFSFYFSVTNNNNKDLYFDPDFVSSEDCSFFQVNDEGNSIIGKPYETPIVTTIGYAAYPFIADETVEIKMQWTNGNDTVWYWKYGKFYSKSQDILGKGSYYTGFQYSFQFRGDKPIKTDTLTFKINFEIQ